MPAAAVLLGGRRATGSPWLLAGCSIYSATMIAVYASSTLSHLVEDTQRRRFFRSLDQAFIYTFIVGTYTPLLARLPALGAVVGVAGADVGHRRRGLLRQVVWKHRLDGPSTWSYLLLGWLPAVCGQPMVGVVPTAGLWWVLIGGLCYTLGVVFLKFDTRPRYLHAVWHLFVIAGTAWHYFAILSYVVPAA